jgi:hypothetical protein
MSIILDGTTGITTPGMTNTGSETVVGLTTSGNTVLGDATTDTLTVGVNGLVKTASGNVGIGTTGPTSRLVVNGGTGTSQTRFEVNTTEVQEVATNAAQNAYANRLADAAQHIWKTSSTESMRLNSSANLGIGTTSPTARVHTLGTTSVGGILVEDSDASNFSPAIVVIGKRNDNNASQGFSGRLALAKNRTDAAVGATNTLGTIYFGGNHTNATLANIAYGASIAGISTGAFNSASDMPSALAFYTGVAGVALDSLSSAGTERMRIVANGDIAIGTVADAGDTLRYVDIQNTNIGNSAGAIIRLITQNTTNTGATTVDIVKYRKFYASGTHSQPKST